MVSHKLTINYYYHNYYYYYYIYYYLDYEKMWKSAGAYNDDDDAWKEVYNLQQR